MEKGRCIFLLLSLVYVFYGFGNVLQSEIADNEFKSSSLKMIKESLKIAIFQGLYIYVDDLYILGGA